MRDQARPLTFEVRARVRLRDSRANRLIAPGSVRIGTTFSPPGRDSPVAKREAPRAASLQAGTTQPDTPAAISTPAAERAGRQSAPHRTAAIPVRDRRARWPGQTQDDPKRGQHQRPGRSSQARRRQGRAPSTRRIPTSRRRASISPASRPYSPTIASNGRRQRRTRPSREQRVRLPAAGREHLVERRQNGRGLVGHRRCNAARSRGRRSACRRCARPRAAAASTLAPTAGRPLAGAPRRGTSAARRRSRQRLRTTPAYRPSSVATRGGLSDRGRPK